MHRILFTAALLALAPACVHAQAATPKADAPAVAPAASKSHNPFGAAIRELTRAAQLQAAAAKAPQPPAPGTATRDVAPKAAPAPAAPKLADSNRS